MSKLFPESTIGRAALAITAGAVCALIIEHTWWDSAINVRNPLLKGVDNYMNGQPFNPDHADKPATGLLVETLAHPTPESYAAAFYNAAENTGAKDPAHPDDRIRAAISCAVLAINGQPKPKQFASTWQAAEQNYNAGHADLSAQGYYDVANACDAQLTGYLAHHPQSLIVPINIS